MAVLAASVTSCTICGTSWCSSTTYNAWPLKRRGMPQNRHHAAPPGVSSRPRNLEPTTNQWGGALPVLHSFGMVHVEVIESLWRYSWIPQTWPQVDLRKKNHQHQLLGNMMFKQTCLKSSKAPFCKDSLLTKNLPDRHSQDLMYASPCLSSKSSGTQDIALWNQPRTSDLGSNNKMDKFG